MIEREQPVFGGAPIPALGLLSVSFRVDAIDAGIAWARDRGLTLRSRIGSEDIGLGKNVVQAQFAPEPISGLPLELIEHQLPGTYLSLTDAAVDSVEHGVEELCPAVAALERIFGSAFGPEVVSTARGLRSRRHARLGIQLSAPLAREAPDAGGTWRRGLRAIAFRCADLDRGVAAARRAGLTVARRSEAPQLREVEFEPWADTSLVLVARTP